MTSVSAKSTHPRPDRSVGPNPAGSRGDATADRERRDATRQLCGGAVWWKGPQNVQFQQGWLLERSSEGAAFLTRGETTPREGTSVEMSTSDPTDVGFRVEVGIVTRMTHVHADLYLIAAQLGTTKAR